MPEFLQFFIAITGQVVDGPHNGPAPGPWDINVQPSKMFSPTSTKVEVPHTASVKVGFIYVFMPYNYSLQTLM